jgi:hypothetical protein
MQKRSEGRQSPSNQYGLRQFAHHDRGRFGTFKCELSGEACCKDRTHPGDFDLEFQRALAGIGP